MMPSGTPNLEHRNACGGGNVAKFSLLGQQFTHYNTAPNHPNLSSSHQNLSSSHSSGLGFSLGAHLQQQDNTQHQPPSSQSHSMLHSGPQTASPHPESHPGESGEAVSSGYNNYHQGFPLSVAQGFSSGYGGHDSSLGGLVKMSGSEGQGFPASSPQALMGTLSVIQQKIQQLQAVVQLMAQGGGQSAMPQQQQALATGVASVISQLVVATAGLLQQSAVPSAQIITADPQLSNIFGGALGSGFNVFQQSGMGIPLGAALGNSMGSPIESFCATGRGCGPIGGGMGTSSSLRGGMGGSEMGGSGLGEHSLGGQGLGSSSGNPRNSLPSNIGNALRNTLDIDVGANESLGCGVGIGSNRGMNGVGNQLMLHGSGASQGPSEDHDSGVGMRDDDDDGEGENLPPGSYELVEMDAAEILAEHTHFCEICGKGFKRDANLRMHMRGHGDEYKTPAALARPDKSSHDPSTIRPRRYSCPFVGCKRNKKHRKFLPLKTMLCVKNHYRRSHCPKMLTCNKCKTKKFSVVADLKTHEKHCGRDKWQCSCGTTFSRKDKLFGHIGLFAGHTPAMPLHEMEGSGVGLESGSGCFNSGNGTGEGLEGLSCNESVLLGGPGSNNYVHGNGSAISAALMVGSGSVMDMGNETAMGVGAGRSEGLQTLGHRGGSLSLTDDSSGVSLGDGSSPPSALVGALVSGSSMLHGLLSSPNKWEQLDCS